ncbi:class II aldolase/adducin family protein [bacterium]|nr:class II aldolase/adducin family protein [bacterium]
MQTEHQLKLDIVESGKRLFSRGFVASNDGNISVKCDQNTILITPTGLSKGFMQPEDIVKCNLEGKKLSGRKEPTSEIKMHLAVYKNRTDIKAIVHAHPPHATGFSVAGLSLDKCTLAEVIISLGSIPLAEYGTPSTEELVSKLENLIANHDAVLLANHGAVTLGKDIFNAYYKMETVEHSAHITFIAKMLGNINTLTQENVEKLMDIRSKFGIQASYPDCIVRTGNSCQKEPDSSPSYPSKGVSNIDEINEEELINKITKLVLNEINRRSINV